MACRLAMPVRGSTVASRHVSATRSASEPKAARSRGSRMRAASTAISAASSWACARCSMRAASRRFWRRTTTAANPAVPASAPMRATSAPSTSAGVTVSKGLSSSALRCDPPMAAPVSTTLGGGADGSHGAKVRPGAVPWRPVPGAHRTSATRVMARKYHAGPPHAGRLRGQGAWRSTRARASSRPSSSARRHAQDAPPSEVLRPGLADEPGTRRGRDQVLQADPAWRAGDRRPRPVTGDRQRLLEVVEVRGVVDVAHRIQVLGPDARHVADGVVRGGRQRHAARLEGAGWHLEHGRELGRDAARHAPDHVGHDPVGVAPQDQPPVRQAALGASARPDPAEPGDAGGERRRPGRGRAAPGSPAPPPARPTPGRARRTRPGRSPSARSGPTPRPARSGAASRTARGRPGRTRRSGPGTGR